MDRQLAHATVVRGGLTAAAIVAIGSAWAAVAGADFLTPHLHTTGAGAFPPAVAMWQAMCVAMMTPTVVPWIAAYARLVAPAGGAPAWRASAAFTGGYFAVWLGYSSLAAALQVALAAAGRLAGDRVGTGIAGLVLVSAGAFQFVPIKDACLAHCRNPLSYFLARWNNGPVGGFRLGVSHGAYCLGCCWLLMLTALALGVMNLAWMGALTVVVALEQLAPWGVWVGRAFGLGLVAWGAWLLA